MLITSTITDRIGQHEVLLPINHNYKQICDILGSFLIIKTQEVLRVFFLLEVKKSHFSLRDGVYCPVSAELRTEI